MATPKNFEDLFYCILCDIAQFWIGVLYRTKLYLSMTHVQILRTIKRPKGHLSYVKVLGPWDEPFSVSLIFKTVRYRT